MNIKHYFVDEKVLELLFTPDTEEKKLSNLEYFDNLTSKVTIGISKDFLALKSVPKERIDMHFSDQEENDTEIEELLFNEEFSKYYREQLSAFYKIFITSQFPKLTEERRREIEDYLMSMQESIDIMNNYTKDYASQLADVKKAIKEEGLTPAEISQLLSFVVKDQMEVTNNTLDESTDSVEKLTTLQPSLPSQDFPEAQPGQVLLDTQNPELVQSVDPSDPAIEAVQPSPEEGAASSENPHNNPPVPPTS